MNLIWRIFGGLAVRCAINDSFGHPGGPSGRLKIFHCPKNHEAIHIEADVTKILDVKMKIPIMTFRPNDIWLNLLAQSKSVDDFMDGKNPPILNGFGQLFCQTECNLRLSVGMMIRNLPH
jgi:hypothetical protein